MNDALAVFDQPKSVSPRQRPWWTVRRPLVFALTTLVIVWLLGTIFQPQLRRWVLPELPVNDGLLAQLVGYQPPR